MNSGRTRSQAQQRAIVRSLAVPILDFLTVADRNLPGSGWVKPVGDSLGPANWNRMRVLLVPRTDFRDWERVPPTERAFRDAPPVRAEASETGEFAKRMTANPSSMRAPAASAALVPGSPRSNWAQTAPEAPAPEVMPARRWLAETAEVRKLEELRTRIPAGPPAKAREFSPQLEPARLAATLAQPVPFLPELVWACCSRTPSAEDHQKQPRRAHSAKFLPVAIQAADQIPVPAAEKAAYSPEG